MLWTPQKGLLRCEHNLGGQPTNGQLIPGTVVTSGASSSTKGSWAELIAATAFDSYLAVVSMAGVQGTTLSSKACLDIGIGAATEEVLIPDLLAGAASSVGTASDTCGPKLWTFPLFIPSGSRLSARFACERTSFATRVAIWLYGGNGYPPFRVGSKVTTYGVASVPTGITITPGASGAEGSWTQIVNATSEDHFAVVPSFQVSGTTVSIRVLTIDIGVGAATEEEIAAQYWFPHESVEGCAGPTPPFPAWADIPSGTRLAMRASCSGAAGGAYEVALHGVS